MKIGRVQFGPGAVILMIGVGLGLVYFGLDRLGLLQSLKSKINPVGALPVGSVVLDPREELPTDVKDLPASQVKPPERTSDNPEVTIGIWTWQTTSGIIDAVGGPGKSGAYSGSCLCQAGITNTRLIVQNDTSEQIKALAAGQLQFVTTTGDQAAVDIAGANKLLRGNKARVVWSSGYSFGEDCLMGPASWKADPQKACGAVVVTAVPYCDWNVTVDWAADNQIPINPDESVYDPTAVNFVNATDHIEAAQKFVKNTSVSLKNRQTGQQEEHQIDAVATWTPGDVMAFEGRSTITYQGAAEKLQKIVSTKEYSYMMPHILFGNADWINQHRDYVQTLLRCIARSNERIKADDEYLKTRVATLNSVIFNLDGRGPNFWYKYFHGATENGVPLGGSRVNNIAEVRHLFGLENHQPIERSIFGITYLDHAKRLQKLMPQRLEGFTPVAQVVDLSFIQEMTDERSLTPVYQAQFPAGTPNPGTVVKANYQINFDSGSARIKPSELAVLQAIRNLLIRASDTQITIEGHTDTTGDDNTNLRLSRDRAQSVWQWLKESDTTGININDKRLLNVEGYGSYRPLPGNKNLTEEEKAANRRVVIILK